MALLLNIDTATETALISVSENATVIAHVANEHQKDHASFLHPAIKTMLQNAGASLTGLSAVAVASGPGSYTGLRVGMASVKGLCYALNIPMITINTLEIMALSSIQFNQDDTAYYCPLIDARRMEVFTAVYDSKLSAIIQPCAMILSSESFGELLHTHKIYFTGSGAPKLDEMLKDKHAVFNSRPVFPQAMATLAYEKFQQQDFADISYASPVYLKEFYTPPKREV